MTASTEPITGPATKSQSWERASPHERSAGPKDLAGLNEAFETGPITMIDIVSVRPITTHARSPAHFLDVAANITVMKRAVNIASPSKTV